MIIQRQNNLHNQKFSKLFSKFLLIDKYFLSIPDKLEKHFYLSALINRQFLSLHNKN